MSDYRTYTHEIHTDYGDGFVRVASHSDLSGAIVQAEHRFINTSCLAVIIKRSDSPLQISKDSDGKVLEWRRHRL